jgi:hypothetical protein
MKPVTKLQRLSLRTIWPKEASDFTPWLAENIRDLGEALGMDLELEAKEASVGDFSLDLLAKDLATGRIVVVENQLTQTDHNHLGKLLTYAAGFGASVVVWLAEAIREEHRQTLEWLNQRTDTETEFFGVVVEVLQIDNSRPAYNFRPVVFPNEWGKSRRTHPVAGISSRAEAYRQYYQPLIDELREKHKFTGARIAQPQSWYSFSSGVSGTHINAVFAGNETARVELYIDLGDSEANKSLFDWLRGQKDSIEKACGFSLEWERLDERRASRISVSRKGSIESTAAELEEIRRWQVERLLLFKKVFGPLVKAGVGAIDA